MQELPQDKVIFLRELSTLQERFAAMKPELEVVVRDPEMNVEGYVVVWNTKISKGGVLEFSGKGGTRVTEDLSLDEVRMLARTMALKNAAAGLPLGGAKSGMRADSFASGFEKKYRRFVSLCKPFLYENGGIFGGFGFDIGARPEMPYWACDELGSLNSFTGKPIEMGGTDYDAQGIAGLGVAVAAKTLQECDGQDVQGASFVVQGLGAMGAAVLRYFNEYGGQIRALGDPKYGGSWVFDHALSEELLQALITQDVGKAKSLLFVEGTQISDCAQDVLYQECEVLFPCAVQAVITKDNAEKIKASYVVEGANQPITAEGYKILYEQKIPVVPDFIANPGGIIAAFVELTSSHCVSREDEEYELVKVQEAKALTVQKISENVKSLYAMMERYDVLPVQAGTYMALSRIFKEGI